MILIRAATRFLSVASLCLVFVTTSALARDMVSIKGSVVNMRSKPSTGSEVLWQLERGYPLQVLKRKGSWIQVRDFENDRGWIAGSLAGRTPHHVVKSSVANIRSGPGTRYRIVGKAERYDLMRTRGAKSDWIKVESTDGVKGWIAKRLLWGW